MSRRIRGEGQIWKRCIPDRVLGATKMPIGSDDSARSVDYVGGKRLPLCW